MPNVKLDLSLGTAPLALLSVDNKDKTSEFAAASGLLVTDLGFELIGSKGTVEFLGNYGVPCMNVSGVTGMDPIMEHLVATLFPHIHGALLCKPKPAHLADLRDLGMRPISLFYGTLYPQEETIKEFGHDLEAVLDKTDMGGVALMRSCAKGFPNDRTVICDPADLERVLAWLKAGKPDRQEFQRALAAKAFSQASQYNQLTADYLSYGKHKAMYGEKVADCAYGENAWQTPAALYSCGTEDPLAVDKFELVQGSAPSYNNWCDVDRLLQTITHIAAAMQNTPRATGCGIAIGCKHGNACGVAVDNIRMPNNILSRMIGGDPRALFGGLVMTNFVMDEERAETLLTFQMADGQRRLLDGIIAPDFTAGACQLLRRKKDKCRLLKNPALANLTASTLDRQPRYRMVRGGFLKQPNYDFIPTLPSSCGAFESINALLAWAIGSTSNSNTITLVKNCMLIGNGTGQQDRVTACEVALLRARNAGHDVKDAVAYSDSFFPFTDGPQMLIDAGITTILTSSGSMNDDAVRQLCQKYGVALVMVPDKEARGFFGH